jgi:hypothetical protein
MIVEDMAGHPLTFDVTNANFGNDGKYSLYITVDRLIWHAALFLDYYAEKVLAAFNRRCPKCG